MLTRLFGIEHVEIAEDIVSDTFLSASESWSIKGPPENPQAWLYVVAKNKCKDYFKHNAIFARTILKQIPYSTTTFEELQIDLSKKNIKDSQLAMIFVVCHPCNSTEAQIGLALNLLCGFSADEIANAFLTNKEVIYKRLQRAKETLRIQKVKINNPTLDEIRSRIDSVLMTLYLLFNEGYYSSNQDTTLRKDLCFEAMRLTYMLIENEHSNKPGTNALLSLMCFHSSRFNARFDQIGQIILYQNQDTELWDQELINKGEYFLDQAAQGNEISKYHLEAGIAFWHSFKVETNEKWQNILQLYNQLLIIEYSPIAALNRTYAFAKVYGKKEAIIEAEKINLTNNHLYHSLLGELYIDLDNIKAISHFQNALSLSKSSADKIIISNKIIECKQKSKGNKG
ncbi:MAG: RNA polymerase sigma factor [Chitinophagaceae bacterium]